MPDAVKPLPEFDRPPVSEVALSIEFSPLERWGAAHGGLYWSRIIRDYPRTETHQPIASQIEKFGSDTWQQQPGPKLKMIDPAGIRFWFLTDDETRLIQIQRDRLIVNWRKVKGTEVYPRYESDIRPRFKREFASFIGFVQERELGKIDVQQCDVTYVNDIPLGEGWDSLSDLPKLLGVCSPLRPGSFLPMMETLFLQGSFEMPHNHGRFHFATQFLKRMTDEREVYQLRLTARGKPDSSSESDVLSWLDIGREWVVRGFADLTTPEAHNLWGRTR